MQTCSEGLAARPIPKRRRLASRPGVGRAGVCSSRHALLLRFLLRAPPRKGGIALGAGFARRLVVADGGDGKPGGRKGVRGCETSSPRPASAGLGAGSRPWRWSETSMGTSRRRRFRGASPWPGRRVGAVRGLRRADRLGDPPALLALAGESIDAVWVVISYPAVQQSETNPVTPLIAQKPPPCTRRWR